MSFISVLVLVSISTPAVAKPPVATCGQEITADFTLRNDVGPCDGPGLLVTGSNLTLNLNGHRVYGNGDRAALTAEAPGIVLRRTTGVTVTGGQPGAQVDSFEAGVVINGGSQNQIKNLAVHDNLGQDPTANPTFGDGILLLNSSDNRIAKNVVTRNGVYDNIGVLGLGSDRNILQNNTVTEAQLMEAPTAGNTLAIGIIISPVIDDPSPTPGVSVYDNTVVDNTVSHNDGRGISNFSSVRGLVRGNVVEDNGRADLALCAPTDGCVAGVPGIGINAGQLADHNTRTVVENNIVRGNGIGINIVSSENTVRNNVLVDNPPPDYRSNGSIFVSGGTRNLVADNTISGGAIGLQTCCSGDEDNTIQNNSILNGRSHGMVIGGVGNHHVMNNQIHNNGGFGLFARSRNNQFLYNNAADNASSDLFDPFGDCDHNTWLGNTWGTGGYNQPCVTVGGSGPNPPSVTAASTGDTSAWTPGEGFGSALLIGASVDGGLPLRHLGALLH